LLVFYIVGIDDAFLLGMIERESDELVIVTFEMEGDRVGFIQGRFSVISLVDIVGINDGILLGIGDEPDGVVLGSLGIDRNKLGCIEDNAVGLLVHIVGTDDGILLGINGSRNDGVVLGSIDVDGDRVGCCVGDTDRILFGDIVSIDDGVLLSFSDTKDDGIVLGSLVVEGD